MFPFPGTAGSRDFHAAPAEALLCLGLHRCAPEASHTLVHLPAPPHARENTRSKMKEKHPKIDDIKHLCISISLHKLTR